MESEASSRTRALFGEEAYARFRESQAVIVGVGGVGGWCAEALARSGVGRLTLVDDDAVSPSNLNRQCCALAATVGRDKVGAMRERISAIDPKIEVTPLRRRWTETTVPGDLPVDWRRPTVVIDAIDSVSCKAQLLVGAVDAGLAVFSSLGAAKRFDPTQVELRRFSKVEGDGLARALRQRFKKLGRFPASDFVCAVSSEPPAPIDALGSAMPVVAAFGLALASAALGHLGGVE